MNVPQRAKMVVSPVWLQVVLVTFLIGFAILGYLAYRIYEDHPPVPGTVVSDKGEKVFTGDEIRQGQELVVRREVRPKIRPVSVD
jgi:nitric oxide reductase subunit B